MNSRGLLVGMVALIVVMVIGIIIGVGILVGANRPTVAPTQSSLRCDQIVPQIANLILARPGCGDTANSEACYVNKKVVADFIDPADAKQAFNNPGSRARISALTSIRTLPLNQDGSEWGVAKLITAADVPNTIGDTPVTFILYGETMMQPADSEARDDMAQPSADGTVPIKGISAFYFSTGLGQQSQCNDLSAPDALPGGALLIVGPDGHKVKFTANGADFVIGSALILRAIPNQEMIVTVLEGNVDVTAAGHTEHATSFQEIHVPLRGRNGLVASGPPSAAVPAQVRALVLRVVCAIAQADGLTFNCRTTPPPTVIAAISDTSSPTPTASLTWTPTASPSPDEIPTETTVPSWTPTVTAVPSWTPTFTFTPSPTNPPLVACLRTHLTYNSQGQVTPGRANVLRNQPSREAPAIGNIPGGAVFNTLSDKPVCSGGYLYWRVSYNNLVGWTAENDASTGLYYVVPYVPAQPAACLPPRVQAKQTVTPYRSAAVYAKPNATGNPIFIYTSKDAPFLLDDGPICSNGLSFFATNVNGIEAYVLENDGKTYYLQSAPVVKPAVDCVLPNVKAPSTVVTRKGIATNLYDNPDVQAKVYATYTGGQLLDLIDGPICQNGYNWFVVDYKGLKAFVIDSDPKGNYYLTPYGGG